MPRTTRNDIEHAEQTAFFEWCEWMAKSDPRFECIIAIPNGGERHPFVAEKMRREGVKAGVPDILVAVPRKLGECDMRCDGGPEMYFPVVEHCGLFIEMKQPGRVNERAGGYITRGFSDPQLIWATRLAEQGYLVAGAWSFEEAKKITCEYLGVRSN